MLNDKHNESGLNNVNSETQKLAKNQPHHSLFKNPISFYNYQQDTQQTNFASFGNNNNNNNMDQYSSSSITLTSRSVPSSRRNSNEKDNQDKNSSLETIFDTKLQLGNEQNGYGKMSNRSSLTNADIIPTVFNQSSSSLNEVTNNNMPTQPTDTLAPSLAFDPDTAGTNHIFQQSPHLSQNNPVYQQPASTFVTPNDYGEFFNGTLQKSSARHNKSLESLRSKSWTQYLDNPNAKGTFLQHTNQPIEKSFDDYTQPSSNRLVNTTTASTAAAAFYNPLPLRRLSYGWQGSDSNRYAGINTDLNSMKSRLTTSQSYSDLRATSSGNIDLNQPFSTSTAAATFGFYNGSSDIAPFNSNNNINNAVKDQSSSFCQQYIQFGYCNLGDQCNLFHPILPSFNDSASSPRSQHSGITTNSHHSSTNTAATSIHPSSVYSSYPMNALFNSSATILNSTGINNPGTTSTIFPVGASSSVYGRPNTTLPFHPSPTQQHQHLYKQQDQLIQQQHHHHHQQQQQQLQQLRRLSTDQDANRYVNANLDDFKGHLYELAKDQNGCRFLQRKIEDTNNTHAIQAIYDEIHSHFVELMTNSFGNYLCQKLLERCDNQQRDTIVKIVAPDIVNISLNMHGTRAVQKLIEYLSTPEQIKVITTALNPSVVPLIKDLNGNHVIQKCLHQLSAEHRQFIYDAVSDKCIEVATHKHGCCVLQRCIDYASDSQKAQLVDEITKHALPLVQDPYGNYVVQYVLELGDAGFSDGLIRRFVGSTCYLSAQKFSSNVIEKCIRVAEPETRKLLITEFIDQTSMEKLLRDSYANYVIQTSLDCADPNQRTELVECIRPLLASVRSTPYGKRIHGKIYREQNRPLGQQQQKSPQ
ncbi:unnamed protein product [Cunninghamella blakesleeana]